MHLHSGALGLGMWPGCSTVADQERMFDWCERSSLHFVGPEFQYKRLSLNHGMLWHLDDNVRAALGLCVEV
jgi:hypothetical protein